MVDSAFSSEATDMQGVAEAAAVAYEPATEVGAAERDRQAGLQWITSLKQSGPAYERLPRHRRTPEEIDRAIRELQELADRYVPPGVSLVDELIADRRAEHRREHPELYE